MKIKTITGTIETQQHIYLNNSITKISSSLQNAEVS